ncbi:MAG: DUF5916 domain-containing protein [Myxococcota bacterium]|nr:DUF5916 domain-containing protein [Myxococcota bacterium]
MIARRLPFFLAAIGLTVLLPGGSVAAAESVQAAPLSEDETVRIDAVFDEGVWARAQTIDAFVGTAPTEGFTPRGTTRVRVASDAEQLYFAWECRFDEPTRVRAAISERERINQDDQVAVQIDPFGDGRRAYIFWLNALGIQQDMVVTLDGQWNPAWDAVFKSAGRLVEGGFDVEIAIPFRSLRFPKKTDTNWRVLFKRKFAAQREYASWPATSQDAGNELLQFADLKGIQPGRSGIGLELRPTVVGNTGQERVDEGAALTWREPSFPETVDPGFGLKWQASPSLALDVAVNPDFSQIEADPDHVDHNLRDALYLPERRPFFLEGNELFDGALLYTRSIVDPIYGVKLSGKHKRLSVAVLHALDEAPAQSFVSERDTPGFSAEDVEGAMSFVSYVGAGWDLGKRTRIALAWSDKELLKDGQLHSSYHGLRASGRFALDDLTTLSATAGISEAGREGGERLWGPRLSLHIERKSRFANGGGGIHFLSPDFRAENAYLTRPDRLQAYTWGERRFEFSGPVPYLKVGATAGIGAQGLGKDEPLQFEGTQQQVWLATQLPALTDLNLRGQAWDMLYSDTRHNGFKATLSLHNHALEFLQGGIGATLGDAVRWSYFSRTLQRNVFVNLNIRAFRRLKLHFHTTFDLLGRNGEPLDRLWLYRVKAVVGFHRILSLRLIAQGRSHQNLDTDRALLGSESRLDLSALLTLVPSPGTSIHLGYGERLVWSPDQQVTTESRDIFLKASLLIRL